MKRMKLNIMGAAKFAFGTSLIGYVLSMLFFAMSCENARIAGVTVAYNRLVFNTADIQHYFCNSVLMSSWMHNGFNDTASRQKC